MLTTAMRKFRKVAFAITHPIGRRGLRMGIAPAITEHRAVLSEKWEAIVDVGANKGQFALAARMLNPIHQTRIICVEPLARPSAKVAKLFSGSVILYRNAIGPERRTVEMHVTARDDSSSLLPPTELQCSTFRNTHEVGRELVEVVRLSDILSPIDVKGRALLKIDVQGYELEALKGCADMLHLFHTIVVECSTAELYRGQAFAADVAAYLVSQGFTPHEERNAIVVRGAPLQADVIYRNHGIAGAERPDASTALPSTILSAPAAA